MDEQLKQKMRDILLECYGVDIDRAKCHFSTQNYAFIFPGEPFMIRVSATPKKTRAEIMSELMWLDDLKQFKQTVCEPHSSLRDKLLEEFEIDGRMYRASMFRTARGVIKMITDMTPMFFICCGDLLGAIHHVSTDEQEKGFKFKRGTKADDFAALKARVQEKVPAEIMQRIETIEAKVAALPREIGQYGICHGDFHMNNFFVEENNVWVFDFDGCGYAHYLYDIASFVQACFLRGYGAGRDLRTVMQDEILYYFKIGYTLNHKCDAHFWDELDLFMAYRTALTYMSLCEIDHIGVVDDTQKIKHFFCPPDFPGRYHGCNDQYDEECGYTDIKMVTPNRNAIPFPKCTDCGHGPMHRSMANGRLHKSDFQSCPCVFPAKNRFQHYC